MNYAPTHSGWTKAKRRVLIAAAAAAVAVLAGCGSAPSEPDVERSIQIKVGALSGTYNPLEDPIPSGNFNRLDQQALYDTLLVSDEADLPQPWLAESWETSEDGLVMTLNLRSDVTFSDGTELTAQHVADYLNALRDSESGMAGIFNQYGTQAAAKDDLTLEIAFEQPVDRQFLRGLVNIPIPGPLALEDPEAFAKTPIGSGPYLIDEIQPEVSITFVRNPNYWNQDAYDFDTVILKAFSDPVAALNAVKSGQLDATSVDIPAVAEAEASGLAVHLGGGRVGVLAFWDHEGDMLPAAGDRRVRQAINMAFDREAILEQLNLGYGFAPGQPSLPGQSTYVEGADDRYSYDPKLARELLAEAGYPNGFDLTLPSNASPSNTTTSFEPIVQQALADIGIRVTFDRYVDNVEYFKAAFGGKYPVYMLFDYWVNVWPKFSERSAIPGIGAGFAPFDADFEKTAEMVSFSDPTTVSSRIVQEFANKVIEESYVVPFTAPGTVWVSSPDIDINVGDLVGVPRLFDYSAAS